MITLIIILVFIAAIIGVAAYLLLGTWIAGLICFLGCVIAICVTVGIVKIIKKRK